MTAGREPTGTIVPVRQDRALLDDILAFDDDSAFALWWLGQSGFLLKWRGRHLLIDPYLSDSLTRKYAGTGREHVRMTARCVDPALLDMVDAAAASHLHTDHLDAATLGPVAQAFRARTGSPLPLVVPEGILGEARNRLDGHPVAFAPGDAGRTVEAAGFALTGIPAAHNAVDRDADGHCLYLGWIIRFGPWCLFHSGDTLWHPDLLPSLLPWKPDVVLVPINGNVPERGVAGNLNGTEAAALALACGATLAIPHHYGMFTFNSATVNEFRNICLRLGQAHAILGCGGRRVFRGPPRSLSPLP